MENNKKKVSKQKKKRWCCVPQCKFDTSSSLHHFPKQKNLREKWIIACRIGQKLTLNSVVCGIHFRNEDFTPRMGVCKRQILKKNAVPSVNLPIRPLDKVLSSAQMEKIRQREERFLKRRENKSDDRDRDTDLSLQSDTNAVTNFGKVMNLTNKKQEQAVEESMDADVSLKLDTSEVTNSGKVMNLSNEKQQQAVEESMIKEVPLEGSTVQVAAEEAEVAIDDIFTSCVNDYCNIDEEEENISDDSEIMTAVKILLQLRGQSNSLQHEDNYVLMNKKKVINYIATPKKEKITFMQLLKNNEDLKVFTGIDFILLKNLKTAVQMCEKRCNVYGCSIEERIVLCLCKLKLNLSFKCLAILFNIERHSCSHLFFSTLHILAFILKDAIYWPTKEEILRSMPKCFKKFQQTYIVLDCTEIPVERSKCLQCRLRLYSHYKGCETIKVLVGISPSGLIIFISKPYGGRASDKAIFNQSNILEKLMPTRDAIMVDKGFTIEEECARAHIQLIIPPKLGKNVQLSVSDITSTVEIAAARVHVERVIQRMKLFNILKSKISIKMAPYMDEVMKIICGLVNLSEPILDDKRF